MNTDPSTVEEAWEWLRSEVTQLPAFARLGDLAADQGLLARAAFQTWGRGSVMSGFDTEPRDADGATRADDAGMDAEAVGSEETVDEHEEAVRRARQSAALAVIAANNRLGETTPQEIYDAAGPDGDAPAGKQAGWWARRFGGASRSA